MRSRGPGPRGLLLGVTTLSLLALPESRSVRAAAPVVISSAGSTKIVVSSSSLAETIDALARVAQFKVTYDGPRPNAMLFNTEIDTPTVAQALARLLEGQNLNHGIVYDLTGKKVTLLMVLGSAPKAAGAAGAGGGGPRPGAAPRTPRNDLPPVDDDPVETEEPEPPPTPPSSPAPGGNPGPGEKGARPAPFQPPSPFAPRPFGVPPGLPRPSPSALP